MAPSPQSTRLSGSASIAGLAAAKPLRVSVSAGVPSVVVRLDDARRPEWASEAMDMAAFREARGWAREGWAL